MKINYVIATYGKSGNRITKYDKFPNLNEVLKEHLFALLRLKHNLSKITIVKPKIDFLNENESFFFDEYYNIKNILSKFDIDYQILNTENDGYSYGQWIHAMTEDKGESDYFIFTEDDLIPNLDYFDKYVVNKYIQNFNNNIGVLTNLVETTSLRKRYLIKIFLNLFLFKFPKINFEIGEGIYAFNKKSVYKILNSKQNPREILNKYDENDAYVFGLYKKNKKFVGYIGGYFQTTFCYFLNKLNITFKGFNDGTQNNLWWNEVYDKFELLNKKKIVNINEQTFKLSNNYFIPVQASSNFFKKNITKKNPKIIFIIGMHRTGTSLLGNILKELGIDYGVNKNTDIDKVNPNGYFENNSFTNFFDKLLKFNNENWKTITDKNLNFRKKDIKNFIKIIKKEFLTNDFFFIKDPRSVKFIDFFKNNFSDFDIRYIVTKREKYQVLDSLVKAQNISYKQASDLYDTHYRIIDKNLTDYYEINYLDLLENTNEEIAKLSAFFNLKYKDLEYLINKDLYRSR